MRLFCVRDGFKLHSWSAPDPCIWCADHSNAFLTTNGDVRPAPPPHLCLHSACLLQLLLPMNQLGLLPQGLCSPALPACLGGQLLAAG